MESLTGNHGDKVIGFVKREIKEKSCLNSIVFVQCIRVFGIQPSVNTSSLRFCFLFGMIAPQSFEQKVFKSMNIPAFGKFHKFAAQSPQLKLFFQKTDRIIDGNHFIEGIIICFP